MRLFKLNDEYTVVCESQTRRGGFKHVATLLRNGEELDSAKCLYVNRTWERFCYESVLCKIINDCRGFTSAQKAEFLSVINR